MSSASRSKKVLSKPSGLANGGNGVPVSGCNPLLGKFHVLDPSPPPSVSSVPPSVSSVHINSHFSGEHETNDLCGTSMGSGAEYDTVSINSSWSGDSEDHKEKLPPHPPLQGDNDKREKIRQKNERKHQRQKERRAQELRDRCSGFLVSRKLEELSQQLVAMGFSSERATMALILNQGKMEESISWLFEEGENAGKHKEHDINVGNLKLDISKELAKVAELGIRYKCSKQDVERAVVVCEGDLVKAEEALSANQTQSTTQAKPITSIEQKRVQKDSSPTKTEVPVLKPTMGLPSSLRRTSPQLMMEREYVGSEREYSIHQLGSFRRDPVVVMQRPQSDNLKQVPATGGSSFSLGPTSRQCANNAFVNFNGNITSTGAGKFIDNNLSSKQLFNNGQHHGNVGVKTDTGYKRGNSPSISVASSLGLFSGSGSTSGSSGPSSPVDWNSSGSLLLQLDYTNVDWTVNPSLSRSKSNGTWQGIGSVTQNDTRIYDPFPSAMTARSGGAREWSSPFEESDIYGMSRQFVSFPTL